MALRNREWMSSKVKIFLFTGESPEVYRTHVLRSGDKILCPILFNHRCEICGATGDRAHTKRHCPHNDGES